MLRRGSSGSGAAALGQRRSGRRARRPAQGAVHRVAGDGHARPERRCAARRAIRARARVGAEGRRHHARLRAGPRYPHESQEPRDRRSRAFGESRRKWPGSAPPSSLRCKARASPRAASTSRAMATRRRIPTSSCRSSSIRSSGSAQVEFVPFKAAIEAGVATMMTAHVFMPALDETRPATLSRRVVADLLRDELNFEGVILSDDLEMKAIASTYAVPSAAVLAIAAGCDGILICSGDHATQAAALEALIYAVESQELPLTRVEDALQAPAARQGAVSDRRHRGTAAPGQGTVCSGSAAKNIASSPTRWRGSCDAEAARPRAGQSSRRRRSGQRVQPRGVRPGDRGASPPGIHAGVRRLRLRAARIRRGPSGGARRRHSQSTRTIPRSRASSPSGAASAAPRSCRCSIARSSSAPGSRSSGTAI